ncbi:MAG: 50S ribosomal protein L4 [Peptoniphilus sp. oral taxon 375]|uniref:50S ribosomal protein L4 n=1 Tax=Urinicoccus timonensis TaxID=2024205 RepID=UPI00021A2BA8|nr:50S ribosomal protein L4 [Urinicoccus timonensis]EGS30094.1 50S ribosomal protein L4 [Peptoniphilus sp. oral taxon 375 str. F0436]MBS4871663.1 50S ribosomal protein L4 [Peptoniphilus sp. oral taxon 375]
MPKIQMLNMEGKSIQEVELKKDIFDVEVNEHAVYLVVKNILANRRQGTQSAKTRAEVRGGGRKPWRQKGTGRARQGSIRSPQWKGGGVVFAPKPRDYSYTTPKKVKRLALRSVLTSKVQENELILVDALKLEEAKTKAMAQALKALNAAKKSLILVGEGNESVARAAKNIAGVKVLNIQSINVYDLLKYDSLILDQEALNKIQEVY